METILPKGIETNQGGGGRGQAGVGGSQAAGHRPRLQPPMRPAPQLSPHPQGRGANIPYNTDTALVTL
eukprot:scaffold14990_cov20-Prasinocladus_malaysianus.AAC.1